MDRNLTMIRIFCRFIIFIFTKYIDIIDKCSGKTQCRTIYEVINELFIKKGMMFTKIFIQQCVQIANISNGILSETKK